MSSNSPTATRSNNLGLYVHWPFCLSKCAYCDFDSRPLEAAGGEAFLERHAAALKREWHLRRASPEFERVAFTTVYFGGGTPTVAPVEMLSEMLALVERTEAEISIEANPGTVDLQKLTALRQTGFNRLSLGVQSFNDDLLRFLGRRHTAQEARQAIHWVRKAGFENLSLDLIFGSPGETPEEWAQTLREAVACEPEHVSAYCLTIEEDTPLGRAVERREVEPAAAELQATMFDQTRELLAEAGYEQYEISNYARPGFSSRHNRNYWRRGEYLGLGAGAHSFRAGVRWWNLGRLEDYVSALEQGRFPVAGAERLSEEESNQEFVLLGLRETQGIAVEDIEALRAASGLQARISRRLEEGLLTREADRIKLPAEKLVVFNQVLTRLLAEESDELEEAVI